MNYLCLFEVEIQIKKNIAWGTCRRILVCKHLLCGPTVESSLAHPLLQRFSSGGKVDVLHVEVLWRKTGVELIAQNIFVTEFVSFLL